MYFSGNIKLLRKRAKRTQDEVASALNIKRSTYSGYENNIAQPAMSILIKISEYFQTSIDILLKSNLTELGEKELSQIEKGYDEFLAGNQLRVLVTSVDSDNEENIELVNEKAKAGYKSGFADPDYIRILPTFRLPFLSKQKKYRTFQISGDSMLPIPDGSWVTGEFIQDWKSVKDRDAYIILTVEDGIVFKVTENLIEESQMLRLYSLNPEYEPYEINIKDIKEIWKFVNFISPEIPEPEPEKEIENSIRELRKDVREIKEKLAKHSTNA
ncbi:MAG: XRE family transcriptional regulator [Bacteroidales bacterium]